MTHKEQCLEMMKITIEAVHNGWLVTYITGEETKQYIAYEYDGVVTIIRGLMPKG